VDGVLERWGDGGGHVTELARCGISRCLLIRVSVFLQGIVSLYSFSLAGTSMLG
jgi:hypothetical protein